MTDQEFKSWASKYFLAFPDARAWLKAQGDHETQATVMRGWFSALAQVQLDEAELVLVKMTAGDLPAVGGFPSDRQQTAVTIRQHIFDQRNRRNTRTTSSVPEAEYYAPRSTKAIECATALAGLLKDIAAGVPRDEALKRWIPATDPERLPRYRCILCFDSGLRKVWSPRTMHDARSGEVKPRGHYQCMTRCTCAQGGRESLKELSQFDELRWCEVGNGTFDEEALRLKAFMESYGEKKAQRMPNYESSFENAF